MADATYRVYKLELDNGVCLVDLWLGGLRDKATRARILRQIDKLERGLFGKEFDGIGELKLDFGPGYRVYYARHGEVIVILLGGGDKSSQSKDIALAKKHWADWKKSGGTVEELPSWSEEGEDSEGDAPKESEEEEPGQS